MSEKPTQPEGSSARPQPGVAMRSRMSTNQRILFFVTAWLIVLMPFLFWWNTWFGRRLSDKQMGEYLLDEKKPRHIQHALVQLGERMARKDPGATRWYPDLVRLASHPIEEVRNTDAWVMGQETSDPMFHEVLRGMLNDPSPTVRGNAALSLVRYGDTSGRPQIVALLQPATVASPTGGQVLDASPAGTPIHQGGLVAKIKDASGQVVELRSPIAGRVRSLGVSQGLNVAAGSTVAVIDPDSEQVWEALRALYLVGQAEDLPAVTPWERELADIPGRIREQARATEKAIRERTK